MEPLEPPPGLDDRSSGAMPAYPGAPSASMTDFVAASSPDLPPPLAPPPTVPPPLMPSATGSQPAYPPQEVPIGFAPTLLPGQMQAPPGGFPYPAAPPVYQPPFPSDAAPAVKRSNKRVIVIAASAAAVVILAVVLALTLGGKHGKHAAAGKGSAGSAAVVMPPPPPAIDAAVAQVTGGDEGSTEGSATHEAVTPPKPESCNVTVTTTPAGADVIADRTVLGHTPGTFALPCGTPTKLTIKKAKYVTTTRNVTPAPEGTKLAVTLGVGTFSVKVTSSPAGAMITVGGRPKGVTPTAIQLPAYTTQTITLTKDGYATDTERISVKANGISHHVTLKRGGRRR
jgi:hypothetical protein